MASQGFKRIMALNLNASISMMKELKELYSKDGHLYVQAVILILLI